MKHLIEERVREAATRVAKENNLELVQAEVAGSGKKLTVRIFIDKESGVMHEDCTLMSRELEKIFDTEDFIPAAYLLEVSSPGLERELYSLQDFKKFAGSLAKVKLNAPVDGQKNFRGRIAGIEGEEIVFDDKTKGMARFPFSAVAKANLEIDLEEELKRNK
ncbi:MAG: ribosome maturation factor RimP [Pyrinomonadaceae bacterium]|nr:ribosome maturation factor RimP [Pyrinomonadaceae bacterium]